MSEGMDQPAKKPHWAWPHVIAVIAAIVVYYLVFRYTGDADAFYTIAIAVAMGGAAWVAAWAYLFRARR
jgi:uncharacterized membrane protein HdeD (DUF308 family)